MLNHQKLQCYQKSLKLVKDLSNLMPSWPTGTSQLKDQMRRAAISVALNISEGCGKTTAPDRAKFYAIARGSILEVSAGIDIAHALGFLSTQEHQVYSEEILIIVKMLTQLIKSTRNPNLHRNPQSQS